MSRRIFQFLMACSLFIAGAKAHAGACLTEVQPLSPSASVAVMHASSSDHYLDHPEWFMDAAMSCKDLQSWKMTLEAAQLTLHISSAALFCTEIGAPVGLVLWGAGGVAMAAQMIVNNLPCEDPSKKDIERLVKREVCESLNAQGIKCNPNQL